MIVHHPDIAKRIADRYSHEDLAKLREDLDRAGTFVFSAMATGLFPAAALSAETAAFTGYGNVWVRDNIHVAHALSLIGREAEADRAVLSFARFYQNHGMKFYAIIEGGRSHWHVMDRPHIRFNGAELIEDADYWPHAQNDALGYFVWFYAKRALAGAFEADFSVLEMFALYFERIEYWRDPDSGHWEERPKIEASSIGPIVAALRLIRDLREREDKAPWRRGFSDARLQTLTRKGEDELARILPWECRVRETRLQRRYDSALLFLVYPLEVVDGAMAKQISDDVAQNLSGDYGVRRYLGDSYWTADYRKKLGGAHLTADYSLSVGERDRLARPGEEAQWCLFDPILSVAAGKRYRASGDEADRAEQVFRFNRSLGQLTGPGGPHTPLRCPELYWREDGRYVTNDHTPLLWTQANLLAAFVEMAA